MTMNGEVGIVAAAAVCDHRQTAPKNPMGCWSIAILPPGAPSTPSTSSHRVHQAAAQSSPIKPNRAIFPRFDMTTDSKTAKFRNWQPLRPVRSGRSDQSGNPQPCPAVLSRRPVLRPVLCSFSEEGSLCEGGSEAKTGLPRRSGAKTGHLLQRYSFPQMKPNKGE